MTNGTTTSLLALHAACEPIFATFYAHELASKTTRLSEALQDPAERQAMRIACARLGSTPEGSALLSAIGDAQWGAQADGTFVTSKHNAYWIADSGDCCTVHAPAKQGELVAASVHHDAPEFVSFASRLDARATREAQRLAAREKGSAYVATLDLVAGQLRTVGARWYRSGSFGGVCLYDDPALDQSDEDMPRVSARGALARAWGVRCTCRKRAGYHAERVPIAPCDACDRAEKFGASAEQFREHVKWEVIDGVHHDRDERIWLFADGALAEHSHEWIAWGTLAFAEANKCNASIPESLRLSVREWVQS